MTAFLPPNLLALFAPRDPLPFIPPLDKPSHYRKLPYTGVAQFLGEFEDPKETPLPTRVETKDERKERKRRQKQEQVAYKLEQDLALWDPMNNSEATSDAYKTLFVARINYDSSESKLRREFEVYGPIKKIGLVKDKRTSKPCGYVFIEYEHERDMHAAYKHADGKKIDNRRVLVDVERARTVRGWRPRRLGGGLGSTRRGPPELNSRFSGREENRDAARPQETSPHERRRRSRSKERNRDGYREKGDRDRERERGERGDRDRDRRRRSRSRSRERRRKRSRSRERRRSRSPRDRRRGARDDDFSASIQQYGEYGAEIRAEYDA